MPYEAVRWYMVESFASRDEAIAYARKRKREEDARGYHRTYRVRKSANTGKWVVENGARADEHEIAHARRFNRMERESSSGQRKLGI